MAAARAQRGGGRGRRLDARVVLRIESDRLRRWQDWARGLGLGVGGMVRWVVE